MPEAARLHDPIAHTSALAGFLIGAVIGLAVVAAGAFVAATCGLGAGLLIGLLSYGIGSALPGIGEAIGKMFSSPSGQIESGSLNVFVNGRNAAFATASTVKCSKHSPVPLVAEGSGNVFINGLPAARKGDAITCGAKIDDGSPNTFIGGGTERYLPVADEVPAEWRSRVDAAFFVAGLLGGLAGILRRAAGAPLRALLPCAARYAAGYVVGEAVGRLVIGPAISRVFGGQTGHPVDVTTGRKLLLASEEVDFTLQSALPLQCGRFYASNLDRVGSLGRGWVLPWELRLERRAGRLWFIDAEGRETGFPMVRPGEMAFSEVEQLYLACTDDGRYRLIDLNELCFDFGQMAPGDGDAVALLQRIEDSYGQWLAFHRDTDNGSPDIRFIISSGGQQLRLLYLNIKGRLTEIEFTHNRKRSTLVKYGYDNDGRLISVTDAASNVTRRFAYADGLMVSHINALGFECRYRWETIDDQPRVVQMGTSEGENALFSYDTQARQTKMVDELGRSAQWTYDEQFQVVECVDLDGKQYRTEYTESGMPAVLHLPAEDGEERTVRFEYDDAGRITAETDVLGRTTTRRYHRNSLRPTALALPDGGQWKAEYDPIGRLLKTTDPLGREEIYAYPPEAPSAWPIQRTDARGGINTLQWNASGQLTSHTDCSGRTTTYAYDTLGHLVQLTDALEQTTRIVRLPTGQPKTIEHPDGSQEHFEHDAAGLLVRHDDRAGHSAHWQRNARGQVTEATDAAGYRVHYRHDPQGRLAALSTGEAGYAFAYDAGDRLIQETRPDGVQRRLGYGAFGQVLALTEVGHTDTGEAPTRSTSFERDAAGRLLKQANTTAATAYTWDDGDRLIQADKIPTEAGQVLGVNPSNVTLRYDKAGRLAAEKSRDGWVSYELDALDNLAALHLPHEQRIDYLSYGSGHVHQVRCGEQVITDIERDALHREVLRTQGRLALGTGYDLLGRKTWQSAGADAAALGPQQGRLWRTWQYSAEGELAEQADNVRGAWQFQHDPAGRLLRRSRPDGRSELERFAWDAAGNLLEGLKLEGQHASAGQVQGNRLRMWQDIRLDYDAWGNLATKRSGSRQAQQFSFDADNRLIQVRTAARGEIVETSFEYDALGRRIGRTERYIDAGLQVRRQEQRRFVWQGLRMVQEIRDSGLSNYVYSADSPYTPMARVDAFIGAVAADAAIAQARASSRVLHFHTDLVGTPLEVTDEAGDIAWAGDYTAWGKGRKDTEHADQAKIEQPLRYAGQYEDSSTGLHFNTFRYYDPEVGRFIGQDPIGLAGGGNLYSYAPNPTGWVDPLGWCGTSTNTGKAVVLGEGMGTVKATAKQLQASGVNAKWYQAWSKNFPPRRMTPQELDAALARNERWIRDKIAKDYKLYDIGIDPRRVDRSPFYELEQRIVKEFGATTLPLPRP
jgi:RHS repeat-associated protein